MKRALTEHEVQRQILDWLAAKRIFHFRNNSGAMGGSHKGKRWFMRFGAVGSPDIFAIQEGRIFGIEVKGAKGKVSDHQKAFGEQLERAGGKYVVAWDLDEVIKAVSPSHYPERQRESQLVAGLPPND